MMLPRPVNDVLTRWVVRPALAAARDLRPLGRATGRAYRAGLAFRREAAGWGTAAREAWMLAQLRRICRYAYDTTDYYRDVWKGIGFDPHGEFGWDDFAKLPVLRRENVRDSLEALRSRALPRHFQERNATGGSTGRPMEFFMGPEENGWRASGAEHAMRRIGLPQGVRRGNLWGHHMDPITRDSKVAQFKDMLANRRWYECLRTADGDFEKFDADLRRWRPHVVVAYASALASFAEFIERKGGPRPNYPRVGFVTGAEKLFPHQREVVERVFGLPVHERYGGRDIGDIGFQFHVPGALHYDIDWAWAHVEPETTDPVAPILMTKLFGDAMPMIRYANDDEGHFPAGARPGHPVFRLEEVVGRVADRIMLPGGGWLHSNHFPHYLKAFPLRDYQVHQRADWSVVVRYVPEPAFTPAHAETIAANLKLNLPGIALTLEPVAEIPRTKANKWRPIVSEVRP